MAWTTIPDLAHGATFSETNWNTHFKANLEYIKAITDLIDPITGDLTYTPAVLADWDGSADPGGVFDALDQLAERVKNLEP